jgi:hypothetical protein
MQRTKTKLGRSCYKEAGITIDGEPCFDDNAYKDAELTDKRRRKMKVQVTGEMIAREV